jgi:dienelactone hydrolase
MALARHEETLAIPANDVCLAGTLAVPPKASGIVLFAHGSGSSRLSPRNRHVAEVLQHAGLATLLFDLLTVAEEREDAVTTAWRFDIPLLARRLVEVTDWVQRASPCRALPLGYFGASTGAAAALIAAAERPAQVQAVVSRGGRPDLAGPALPRVKAPTLLLVGGHDPTVLRLNRDAAARMQAPVELVVVPGATHLFEEPGTLDAVATAAAVFLSRHLTGATAQ